MRWVAYTEEENIDGEELVNVEVFAPGETEQDVINERRKSNHTRYYFELLEISARKPNYSIASQYNKINREKVEIC